jgi:signal transduction histidine kinase
MRRMVSWLDRSKAAIAAGGAFCLLAGVFWLSFRNTERFAVDAAWRSHTYDVISEVRAVLNSLLDAESSRRGFLLSGDPRLVAVAYPQDRAQALAHLARLRALTVDNPRQQRRLAVVTPAATALLDNPEGAAERGRAAGLRDVPRGHPGSAVALAASDEVEHRRLMAAVRARLAEAEADETSLLAQRDQAMLATLRRTHLSLVVALAASVALLAAAYVALRREIVQRRSAENAMHRLNTRLKGANRELEAFCYSVSHDLRAPLRAIDGFSLALAEDAERRLLPADRDLLARVRAAAQRMAVLIDDLLRLSQISRTLIEYRDVDLSALARAVAAELEEHHPARRVVVEIDPEVRGRGDERLLRVVLENLFGNAWKFTSRRAEAHIAFGMEAGEEGPVYFVRDDGAGFDMAYAGKLFGAFQRLHAEREFAGSGIGLATVARVIQLHGGRVWAESAVGRGATLRFTLAAAEPPG